VTIYDKNSKPIKINDNCSIDDFKYVDIGSNITAIASKLDNITYQYDISNTGFGRLEFNTNFDNISSYFTNININIKYSRKNSTQYIMYDIDNIDIDSIESGNNYISEIFNKCTDST